MVRLILLIGLVGASLWAGDHTVCASGCDYNTMQAAIDHVSRGDTITLTAGTSFTSVAFHLDDKPGSDWVTIRSSKADLLPEGYRPADSDTRLATIAFTATGNLITTHTKPAFSSNCWTSQVVGNTVTFGYLHGGGLTCEARLWDETLLTSSTAGFCSVTLAGSASPPITAGTSIAQGTGLRVGLATDGTCRINHLADIVLGTHYSCTNCSAGVSQSGFQYPDQTVPLGTIGYSTTASVTTVSDKRVWLSGPQANKTNMPGLYPSTYAAAYKGPANGVHHYRFIGIRFRWDTTTEKYSNTLFYDEANANYQYVPHHLEWDRCVFSQPKASLGFWKWIYVPQGENILVRNSRFLNQQTRAESQSITMGQSEGPLILENIEIDGMTEHVMVGGFSTGIAGVPQVTMTRSLMRKRLEQFPNLGITRHTSTDVLALVTRSQDAAAGYAPTTTRCNAGTCVAYYEDTPYTFTSDSTITLAAGTSAKLYIGVSPTGVLTVGHNSGANVTCAGNFTCLNGITSRDGMAEYAMLYEWTGTTGAWAAASDRRVLSNTHVYHKNLFELKSGKNILVEGNIFRNYWASEQSSAIGFTVRNQNGQDVSSRLDGLVFTRNKIVGAHSGINTLFFDTSGGNTLVARRWSISHNILADIHKTRWGNYTSGGYGIGLFGKAMVGMSIDHNTIDYTNVGLWQNSNSQTLNSVMVTNNLWMWGNGNSVGGDGIVNWNSAHSEDDIPVPSYGYIAHASIFQGNQNLGLSTIAHTGWGTNWADNAAEHFWTNDHVPSIVYSDYLTSVSTPRVLTDNFRLKTTTVKSIYNAGYDGLAATTDGLDNGADVDWVETLTDGVNEGYPTWGRRKALRIERGGATATVGLSCPGETATVTVASHQRMKTADEVYTSSVACGSARQTFSVTGMTPGTSYWIKVSTSSGVYKERI